MTRPLAVRGFLAALAVATLAIAAAYVLDVRDSSAGDWFVLAVVVVAASAACAWMAFFASGRALDQVVANANMLGSGGLRTRAEYSAGPVDELTSAFNSMAARLEEQFEEFRSDQARISAIFAAVTDGLVALSADTSILFLNPAAEKLLDEPASHALGRPFIEISRDYELDGLVRKGLASPEPLSAVVTFGPARVPLRATAIPVPSGGRWALLFTLSDLTEIRRLDTVRRDFIGNVSHELRTPLASIRALVETIEASYVEQDELPEFYSRIHQQVDRLTALVTELLDLTRIESGAAEMHPEPMVIGDAVREAASALQPRLAAAEVTLVCADDQDLGVEADHRSLVRIITNLLDNAIRFSPKGSEVKVEAVQTGDLISLSVTDQGPGIPEADVARVFERFYTGDKSRAQGGAGLGLAIVKHLVRAHNGTVEARNNPQARGAIFTVSLPRTSNNLRPEHSAGRRSETRPVRLFDH